MKGWRGERDGDDLGSGDERWRLTEIILTRSNSDRCVSTATGLEIILHHHLRKLLQIIINRNS